MRRAIVKDGVVVNVVALPDDWDGSQDQWQPPAGDFELAELPDAGPTDMWDGQTLTRAVREPEKPKLNAEQILDMLMKKGLISQEDIDEGTRVTKEVTP